MVSEISILVIYCCDVPKCNMLWKSQLAQSGGIVTLTDSPLVHRSGSGTPAYTDCASANIADSGRSGPPSRSLQQVFPSLHPGHSCSNSSMHSSCPPREPASSASILARMVRFAHQGARGAARRARTKIKAATGTTDSCDSRCIGRWLRLAHSRNILSIISVSRSVFRSCLSRLYSQFTIKLLTWDHEAVADLLVAIQRPTTPPISLLITAWDYVRRMCRLYLGYL